jgi:hypothetical protein
MRHVVIGCALLTLVACASAPPRPVQSGFEDIPVPRGLSFKAEQSTIIESANVRAARQIYTGRIEPESLATAFKTTLEANGWRPISSNRLPGQGTTQVYEKAGNSLQVRIYDGFWTTWVEVTAIRVFLTPGPTSSTR